MVELEDLSLENLTQTNKLLEEEILRLNEHNSALKKLAFQDSLTRLPNRAYFFERLKLLIELGIGTTGNYYIVLLDINRYRYFNENFGYAVGDLILRLFARRLRHSVRKADTVVKIGGDEFAVILNNVKTPEDAENIVRRMCQNIGKSFRLKGNRINISTAVGYAPLNAEHKLPENIVRDCEIALNVSKHKELPYQLFSNELRDQAAKKSRIEIDLRKAIEDDKMSLAFQPLVSLENNRVVGFEALSRWQHPQEGLIPPENFIPVAEESDLIVLLANGVIEHSTRKISEWQKTADIFGNLYVSVNISGRHLADNGLLKIVSSNLEKNNISPASLKLEITETVAVRNYQQTIKMIEQLKSLGTQISIDDFGTGYSSLNYLQRLPLDTLKIDRTFVAGIETSEESRKIIETIMILAKNLKFEVVAEGIETKNQLDFLRDSGCDFGQGYLISHPIDGAFVVDYLTSLPEGIWQI